MRKVKPKGKPLKRKLKPQGKPAERCPVCGSYEIGWCDIYGGWWCDNCGSNAEKR